MILTRPAYTLKVTKTGEDDLFLPLRSFSATFRQSPQQCYLSVVIPTIQNYIDDIELRISGELWLYQDADLVLEANISDFRADIGSNNASGSIVGYKTITYTDTTDIDVPFFYYRRINPVAYRTRPIIGVLPLRNALVDGGSIEVGYSSWTVNAENAYMEFGTG